MELQYRTLASGGTDLIFIDPDNSGWEYVTEVVEDHPDTAFAVIDGIFPVDGARSVYFADQEAGFLAGLAAALTTQAGAVGFIGGHQSTTTERWRAGFESGVSEIDPEIEVLAIYISTEFGGIQRVENGRLAAEELFGRGADVVLAFAGDATLGVLEVAAAQSTEVGEDRWVIGSETDWSVEINSSLRSSLLTSALRKQDVALVDTIRAFTSGTFAPGTIEIGLAAGAVGLAPSEYLSAENLATIASLTVDVLSGTIVIPTTPAGDLMAPPGSEIVDTVTVVWDGEECKHEGRAEYPVGSTLQVNFVNESTKRSSLYVFSTGRGIQVSLLGQPTGSTTGYFDVVSSQTLVRCIRDPRGSADERRADEHLAVTLIGKG